MSPVTISAVARHRSALNSVLQAGIRAGIGSGKISATRVIHLGLKRVSARLWATRAMVEAGLCSGASPACEHSRCSGSEQMQTGAVLVRGAKASQNRSRAWLCCAVGGPPRRSRGVCRWRPVFWPRGCILDHDSQSKRKGRSGQCSPRVWIGQSCNAGWSASMASGGARTDLGVKVDGVLLRLLIHQEGAQRPLNKERGSRRAKGHRR